MIFKYLLPVIVGFSIVFQGTLNRSSSGHIGLASAIFVNSLVFFIFATGYWFLTKYNILTINGMDTVSRISDFQWWQILPGIFGFLIVFCTPIAIGYLGANLSFGIIICTQLLVSLAWDSVIQKSLPNTLSIVGAATMVIGLGILLMGKK